MKIILLCDALDVGGAETHVLSLATELRRLGHRALVTARGGAMSCGLENFCELDVNDALYIVKLYDLIKREAPDIVHAHTRRTALAVSIVRRMSDAPRFAFITTAHARYRTNGALTVLSRWGDECIAVSRDIRRHLEKYYRQDSAVIPNGIDTDDFSPSKGKAGRILFVGRLDRDSSLGAECLCKIAPRLANCEILIAGGGSELSRLQKNAPHGVSFLGKRTDIARLMRSSELVVGVSRVALEAMSCGKKVVLFGNEGALGFLTKENIGIAERTNFTCRSCGVKDAEFLLSQLKKALSSDQCSYREYVLAHHSQREVTLRTLEVYKKARAPRILLGGYYGCGNLGDELLLMSASALVRRVSPYSRLITLYGTKDISKGRVLRHSPAVVNEMRQADIFILGGGSLLQNETSGLSLLYYCTLIALAGLFGCRIVILSNGIGPLKGRLARRLAGAALSKADSITARDRDSKRIMESLSRRRVCLSADLCYLLNINTAAEKGSYAVLGLKAANGAIGSRLCAFGISPVYVAMDKNDCGDKYTANELFDLVSGASLVISERLHLLILSSMLGTPYIALGDSPKLLSFIRESTCYESGGKFAANMRKRAAVCAKILTKECKKPKK